MLGQCHYLLGDPETGDAKLELAAALDPSTDLFRAYVAAGSLLYGRKRFEESIRPFRLALDQVPSGDDSTLRSVRLSLGYAYLKTGHHHDSRRTFERFAELHGFDVRAAFYLARSCDRLEEHVCAMEAYRSVVDRGHEDERLRTGALQLMARRAYEWALLPANAGQRSELIERAVEDARRWYEIEPGVPLAARLYASALIAADRSSEVLSEFTEVHRQNPQACHASLLVARALNAEADGVPAAEWATLASRCDPTDVDARIELASAWIHQVSADHAGLDDVHSSRALLNNAIESLELATRLDPTRGRASLLIAEAEVTLEQLARVEQAFIENADDHRRIERELVVGRCRELWWVREHDTRELTAEEKHFFDEHDCRRRTGAIP